MVVVILNFYSDRMQPILSAILPIVLICSGFSTYGVIYGKEEEEKVETYDMALLLVYTYCYCILVVHQIGHMWILTSVSFIVLNTLLLCFISKQIQYAI